MLHTVKRTLNIALSYSFTTSYFVAKVTPTNKIDLNDKTGVKAI